MTVADFIKELQSLPQNAKIKFVKEIEDSYYYTNTCKIALCLNGKNKNIVTILI
jgi:hypothetical protein